MHSVQKVFQLEKGLGNCALERELDRVGCDWKPRALGRADVRVGQAEADLSTPFFLLVTRAKGRDPKCHVFPRGSYTLTQNYCKTNSLKILGVKVAPSESPSKEDFFMESPCNPPACYRSLSGPSGPKCPGSVSPGVSGTLRAGRKNRPANS